MVAKVLWVVARVFRVSSRVKLFCQSSERKHPVLHQPDHPVQHWFQTHHTPAHSLNVILKFFEIEILAHWNTVSFVQGKQRQELGIRNVQGNPWLDLALLDLIIHTLAKTFASLVSIHTTALMLTSRNKIKAPHYKYSASLSTTQCLDDVCDPPCLLPSALSKKCLPKS